VDRRDVERLVPPSVGRGTVPTDREGDPIGAAALVRERDAGRDRIAVGEHREHRERLRPVPISDVAVAVAPTRVPVDASPELRHHALEVETLRELRREVTVRDEQRVVRAERVRRADVGPLLPPAGVDRAGQPALPVERLHALVEVPAELEEVEDLPEPVVVEPVPLRGGVLRPLVGYLRRHRRSPSYIV
jgi:hypothetical protein